MKRFEIRSIGLAAVAAVFLLGAPATASAQANGCAIDYDTSGIVTTLDYSIFVSYWVVGNTLADLNADNVVDFYDALTFAGFFTLPVCPWNADYQYNRSIDPVDRLFFNFLFSVGNLRADLDRDGALTVADVALFSGVYNTTY